jgi:hypothetical protein
MVPKPKERILILPKRPDILAPSLNVSTNDDGLVTPGYIFIAPYEMERPGPYIYTTDGVCNSLARF